MNSKEKSVSDALGARTTVDVQFQGPLDVEVRSKLVKELVKYVLYESGQIPMCFDQIKEFCKRQELQTRSFIEERSRPNPVASVQMALVKSVEALCDTIQSAFAVQAGNVHIRKVILLLGSSFTAPKQSLLFNLPPPSAISQASFVDVHARNLRTLFKAIFEKDILFQAKALSVPLTTLSVFFLGARSAAAEYRVAGLQPCLSFSVQMLRRGCLHVINAECKENEDVQRSESHVMDRSGSYDETGEVELELSKGEDVDVSGVVPFSPLISSFSSITSFKSLLNSDVRIYPGPAGLERLSAVASSLTGAVITPELKFEENLEGSASLKPLSLQNMATSEVVKQIFSSTPITNDSNKQFNASSVKVSRFNNASNRDECIAWQKNASSTAGATTCSLSAVTVHDARLPLIKTDHCSKFQGVEIPCMDKNENAGKELLSAALRNSADSTSNMRNNVMKVNDDDDDYVWYRAVATVKGYVEKPSKSSVSSLLSR